MGEWRCSPTILDIDTRWRRMVSFTPRLLYPYGKSPLVVIGYEVEWAQSPVWTP
jgi:hypothetical protein